MREGKQFRNNEDRLDRDGRQAERELRVLSWRHHTDRVAEMALAGTVAGALAGAVAGPVGALAGAALGGIVGALAGGAMDNQGTVDRMRDEALDKTIGVVGGDLGAASPSQPPSRRSFVSPASAGAGGGGGGTLSEGPIPPGE